MTVPFDPRFTKPQYEDIPYLPRLRPDAEKPGWLRSGLVTGGNELQASLGSALAAVGKATNSPRIEQTGLDFRTKQLAEAQASGRTDLEGAFFREGSGPFLPQLGYQFAKQAVNVLPAIAAAALTRGRAPKFLSVLGAEAPAAIGGGGGLAGVTGAARVAALRAGSNLAGGVAAATVAGVPQAVGQMYDGAIERGDATRGDAFKAIGLAPVYSALEALQPAGLARLSKVGSAGAIIKRLATAGAIGVVEEAPQEAIQTAMELSFRPDIAPAEKMRQIVDAAVAGGLIGGVAGGLGGVRAAKSVKPQDMTTETLAQVVDQDLAPTTPAAPAAPEAAPPMLAPDAAPGEQGELFAPQTPPAPRSPLVSDVPAAPVAPVADPAQPDLFQEDLDRQAQVTDMQTLARQVVGRKSAFVEQLQATNPIELITSVQDALAQGRTSRDVVQLGAAFGLVTPEGTPRDLAAELAKKTAALPTAMLKARDGSARAVQQVAALQQEIKQLTRTQETLQEVATLREEQGRPLPEKPKPYIPTTVAERIGMMQEVARGYVGRTTQFIKQLKARDEVELADAVITRLEKGSAAKDVLQLAEAIGVMDAQGNERNLPAEIAAVQAQLQSAPTPELQTQLETLQTQNTVLEMVKERRGEQTPPVGAPAAPIAAPTAAPTPTTTEVSDEGNAQATDGQGINGAPVPESGLGTNLEVADDQGGQTVLPLEGIEGTQGQGNESRPQGEPVRQKEVAKDLTQLGLFDQPAPAAATPTIASAPAPVATVPKPRRTQATVKAERAAKKADAPLKKGVLTKAGLFRDGVQITDESGDPVVAPAAPAKPRAPRKRPKAGAPVTRTEPILDVAPLPEVQAEAAPQVKAPRTAKVAKATKAKPVAESTPAVVVAPGPITAKAEATTTESRFYPKGATAKYQQRSPVAYVSSQGVPLVQLARTEGQVTYHAVNPKNNVMWTPDVEDARPLYSFEVPAFGELDEATRRELVAAKQQLMAEDTAGYAQAPDGPFTNATSNVVATAGVDARYTALTEKLLTQLGMSSVRVMLVRPSDVSGPAQYNLYGPYRTGMIPYADANMGGMIAFGPTGNDYIIYLTDTLLNSKNTPLVVESLAHEIGHIVEKTQLRAAAAEVREAITKAWREAVRASKGMNARKIITFLRGAAFAETQRGRHAHDATLSTEGEEYLRSFNEWFADQVSKWVTTDAAPVGIVEQFFTGVAQKIRQVVMLVTGRPYVVDEMEDFLDGLAATQFVATDIQTPGPVQALQADMQAITTTARNVFDAIDRRQSATTGVRKALLGMSTVNHMMVRYRALFDRTSDRGETTNGIEQYTEAKQTKATLQAQLSQLFTTTFFAYEQLEKTDAKSAESVRKLMRYTEFEIDPRLPWEKHTWLQERANKDQLKTLVDEAYKEMNTLRQKRQVSVYDNFLDVNNALHFGQMAVSLYNLAATDPVVMKANLAGFEVDPADAFRMRSDLHKSPQSASKYWRGVLDTQQASIETYIAAEKAAAASRPAKEQQVSTRRIGPLESRSRSIKDTIANMEQSPYFHLGRTGDWFVGFTLRSQEKGKVVDQAAIDHVAKTLEAAGFTDAQISRETTKPNVFLRVDTIEQSEQLFALAKQFKTEGWLNPEIEIKKGRRMAEQAVTGVSPEFLDRYIQSLDAAEEFQERDDMTPDEVEQVRDMKKAMIAHAREIYLDQLPDTAIAKMLVQRNAVPGYSKDMIRNFAFRMSIGVNALAGLSAAAKTTKAFTAMRAAVNDAKASDTTTVADTATMQDVLGELSRREAETPLRTPNTFIDTVRAINHAFFLGASPSYVAINLTQLGVLLWPELSKRHGFVKSATAIAKVTPDAFKIMKATLSLAVSLGPKRWADAIITEDALVKSGISADTAAFVMRVVNTGAIDIGAPSRELGRVADGKMDSKTDTALRYASAAGAYSETFTRLVAALSARELHGEKAGLDKYVGTTITESMLNYSTANTARLTGRMGLAGKFSPIIFSFQQYTLQVTEKLYRELSVAFIDRTSTSAEKMEARRFLGYHLAAMVTLTGTLGMPAASVFARAAEALKDLWDDDEEPWDAKAAWRNMLADMFGKDVGELIARGVPRAAGIDIATRAGEQDIIPFSRLLTDRRKWQDASKDWALQALGSPASMLNNILQGVGKISDGDVLTGMQQMMPVAIKGPITAFRMSEQGYTDNEGNVLPMSAGATAILAQALGFTPAAKGEYNEARMTQTVRKGQLAQQASVLRRQLALAVEQQDRETFTTLLGEARAFDQSNPAYAVLPSLGGSLQRRAKARAQSRLTSNPLGTNIRDRGAQQLTNFANF